MIEKKKLRSEIRKQIKSFQGSDLSRLAGLVQSISNFKDQLVALYQADSQEISLLEYFPEAKIYLPRYSKETGFYDFALWSGENEELRAGPYGILEPKELIQPKEINFVFIPGLAFTKTGERLGRGGGFYDRLLAKYSIGTRVGVCHDFQLLNSLPTEGHDCLMDYILTPSELIKCDRINNN